jgi:UDP-glucose 4-epimerase
MAKHYLVTGGSGFIGSHLVQSLLERGDRVRVLDNLATGRRSNLAGLEQDIDLHTASIADIDAVERAMQGIDYVLHHAAIPSVLRSVEQPRECHDVNVTGTFNILQAALQANVQKVVFAASSSVYGNTDTALKHERMPHDPLSPYALAKLTGEYYCHLFSQLYGLPTVALRYFNIFGPRQDPTSIYSAVIPLFISKMLRGEAPTINGDGRQTRDFTYVANVVAANLLACEAAPPANGQVMNIACGQAYSLLDLVALLNALLGTSIRPIHAPPQAGDIRHSLAAIERANELIGYSPVVEFAEGLKHTIASLQTVCREAY